MIPATPPLPHGQALLLELEDNCHDDLAMHRPAHHLKAGAGFLANWAGCSLAEWGRMGVTVFSHQGQAEVAVSPDGSSHGQPVFTLGGREGRHWVNTHNHMGVVRLRDPAAGGSVQIQIGSRFDSGHPRPYFLTYLLSRVFGGSIVQEVDIGKDPLWDLLLAFAFRRKLLAAAATGLFKEYRTHHHDDARVRGCIDIDRHLRTNIPFRGKVSYSVREFSYDNPLNHLIRHALEKVRRKWPRILDGCGDLTDLSRLLHQNTPTWNPADVRGCLRLAETRRPVRHPHYHGTYEPLRRICRALLEGEGAGLYRQEQEADGVLFDGAWLWEEYLWTILRDLGYSHPRNKEREGGLQALPGVTFYPDFLHRGKRVILDAKYQRADGGPSADAVRQVLCYMFLTDARHGGLIKPSGEGITTSSIRYHGPDGRDVFRKWHDISLAPLPATTAAAFLASMEHQERKLRENLEILFAS